MKQAQAVRALAAISKLIRSPEIRTHFKATFCCQASRCTWSVGNSACLKTTVDSQKRKKKKGKELHICWLGLATGVSIRLLHLCPSGICSLMYFSGPASQLFTAPSPQPTATVNFCGYSPIYRHVCLQMGNGNTRIKQSVQNAHRWIRVCSLE